MAREQGTVPLCRPLLFAEFEASARGRRASVLDVRSYLIIAGYAGFSIVKALIFGCWFRLE